MNFAKIRLSLQEGMQKIIFGITKWNLRPMITMEQIQQKSLLSLASSSSLPIEDEELDILELQSESDNNETFQFVSILFDKTIQTYSGIQPGIVQDLRKIREQISNEIKDMTFDQERSYLDKLLADNKQSTLPNLKRRK